MPTAAESRLIPFIGYGMNKYATTDKQYIISANPVTIIRFGPSVSLKKKNSILEQMMAVTASAVNEIFFDLKCSVMLVSMFIR
jgi:hypothetical protein